MRSPQGCCSSAARRSSAPASARGTPASSACAERSGRRNVATDTPHWFAAPPGADETVRLRLAGGAGRRRARVARRVLALLAARLGLGGLAGPLLRLLGRLLLLLGEL